MKYHFGGINPFLDSQWFCILKIQKGMFCYKPFHKIFEDFALWYIGFKTSYVLLVIFLA